MWLREHAAAAMSRSLQEILFSFCLALFVADVTMFARVAVTAPACARGVRCPSSPCIPSFYTHSSLSGSVCTPSPAPIPLLHSQLTVSSLADVVIVSAVRTAIGSHGGAFASLSATKLGGAAVKAAVARAGVKGEDIGEALLGNVVSAGLGQAPARQAVLFAGMWVCLWGWAGARVSDCFAVGDRVPQLGPQARVIELVAVSWIVCTSLCVSVVLTCRPCPCPPAGLPQSVEATTINKVCASGMKAIALGAQTIALGHQVGNTAFTRLHSGPGPYPPLPPCPCERVSGMLKLSLTPPPEHYGCWRI